MVRASPIKTSFNAGEWSPLMSGHINLERFPDSCQKLTNMIALKQGPITRRGGTYYVSTVKNSAHNTCLAPFKYSISQAYIIEMGNLYFRFYEDYAPVMDGLSPYEIVSPYDERDLKDANGLNQFQTAQSADVMYIAHGSYNVNALSRTSSTNWSIAEMSFIDGPYLEINATATTLSLTTGTVTASSTTGINGGQGFLSTDVGRLIRVKDGSHWDYGVIATYINSTSVTVTGTGITSHTISATTDWRLGLYSETTGYPRVITFFQNRVFLGGCDAYPDRWDLSKSAGYSSTEFQFAPSDSDGTVTDDAAIYGTLNSGEVNNIQWAKSDSRGLLIGTASHEWIIRASTNGEVLSPSNAKADKIGDDGSAYIQPAEMQSSVVFSQFSRRKVLDVIYSLERDDLIPRDLTVTSEHITRSGCAQFVSQKEPINCIWTRLTNGRLVGLTYYPLEQVFAFHEHIIGGNGSVVSIASIPSSDLSRDDLWLLVERTIDGNSVQYIEYMTRYYEDDIGIMDAICVDSAITYDGVSTSIVTGLDHLEGEVVKVMVDGRSHPDLTVSGGEITLANDRSGEKIQIGFSAPWVFKSQRMEAGSTDGTSQGKRKRIVSFVVRLLNSLGLYYGPDGTKYDAYDFNQGASYDETVQLFSGDTISLTWPGGTTVDGIIYLHHDGGFPITILSIMPQIVTRDKG